MTTPKRLDGTVATAVSDIRMVAIGDTVWATHPAGSYEAWSLLRSGLGDIDVIARQAETGENLVIASGPGVGFTLLPDYSGYLGLLRVAPQIVVRLLCRPKTKMTFIRLPEPLSLLAGAACLMRNTPIVVNVVADPTTLGGPLSRLASLCTRQLVLRAKAVVYVTDAHLQRLYPASMGSRTLARSNVVLADDWFQKPRRWQGNSPIRLITVVNNQSLKKGQDIALEAVRILRQSCPVELTIVGGGRMEGWLANEAVRLGLQDSITLSGYVADRALLAKLLDDADIFILPSRSEGLPRAMLEAMARGLPSVGSHVGGIAELLPAGRLIGHEDAAGLAVAVSSLFSASEYEAASEADVLRAREVADRARPERYIQFLQMLDSRHGHDRA